MVPVIAREKHAKSRVHIEWSQGGAPAILMDMNYVH